MSILTKVIYRFNAIPIIVNDEFYRTRTNVSKNDMEPQKAAQSNSNSEEEEQSWRNHSTHMKLYYKAIVIKTAWYCHKN